MRSKVSSILFFTTRVFGALVAHVWHYTELSCTFSRPASAKTSEVFTSWALIFNEIYPCCFMECRCQGFGGCSHGPFVERPCARHSLLRRPHHRALIGPATKMVAPLGMSAQEKAENAAQSEEEGEKKQKGEHPGQWRRRGKRCSRQPEQKLL